MATKKRTKGIYRLGVVDSGPIGRCAPLCEIHHVSHLMTARRILRKGRIPSRLVDDESRLDGRASVCWLAPNQWGHRGSRYGTVQFTFDFEELVRNREIFWVEGVPGRRLPACRLLITCNRARRLKLKRYDPERTEGPLRRVGGSWYWRDDLEFEVMLDGGLSLTNCLRVSVVPHNGDRCRDSCGEVGQAESETAARLLAGLMRARYLLPEASFAQAGRASPLLHSGWFGLVDALDLINRDPGGSVKSADGVDTVVRTALSQMSRGDAAGASETVLAVAGGKRVRKSLRRLLQRRAGVKLGSPHDTIIGLIEPSRAVAAAAHLGGGARRHAGQHHPAGRDIAQGRGRPADVRAGG
jgi:hypothetical protein